MSRITHLLLLAIALFLCLACIELHSINRSLNDISSSANSMEGSLGKLSDIDSDLEQLQR